MLFNLLGENNDSTIDLNVFDDVELSTLFNYYLTKNQTENIISVLKKPANIQVIKYRQQVFLELENNEIDNFFTELKNKMWELSKNYEIFKKTVDKRYKQVYYLNLLNTYIEFISISCNATIYKNTKSVLINQYIKYFMQLYESDKFTELKEKIHKLYNQFNSVKNIKLDIKNENGFPVSYKISRNKNKRTAFVEELIDIANKFGLEKHIRSSNRKEVTSFFLNSLNKLCPQLFNELKEFYEKYKDIFNLQVFDYNRQISFYLNMKQLYIELRKENIPLCIPEISNKREIDIINAYDISLCVKTHSHIIPNDIKFDENQGFYILTGTNSGGKTTYIRTIGICQILFLGGCYVPAEKASIFPLNKIFSHFPSDERFDSVGRLKDEQIRINDILKKVDENSLVLLNETYSSTNEQLAVKLSIDLIKNICSKGSFGIFVTHQHRVTKLAKQINEKTKIGYLEAVVLQDQNKTRTYKIKKISNSQFNDKSYTQNILKKYGLTREILLERFAEVD